jgi:hypothetical protein
VQRDAALPMRNDLAQREVNQQRSAAYSNAHALSTDEGRSALRFVAYSLQTRGILGVLHWNMGRRGDQHRSPMEHRAQSSILFLAQHFLLA